MNDGFPSPGDEVTFPSPDGRHVWLTGIVVRVVGSTVEVSHGLGEIVFVPLSGVVIQYTAAELADLEAVEQF